MVFAKGVVDYIWLRVHFINENIDLYSIFLPHIENREVDIHGKDGIGKQSNVNITHNTFIIKLIFYMMFIFLRQRNNNVS